MAKFKIYQFRPKPTRVEFHFCQTKFFFFACLISNGEYLGFTLEPEYLSLIGTRLLEFDSSSSTQVCKTRKPAFFSSTGQATQAQKYDILTRFSGAFQRIYNEIKRTATLSVKERKKERKRGMNVEINVCMQSKKHLYVCSYDHFRRAHKR